MLVLGIIGVLFTLGWSVWFYLYLQSEKKMYSGFYYSWEKLASAAERDAMLAEEAEQLEVADWLYEAAARRRIFASKYIKYLPKEEQAKAIELNTWSGIKP